MTKTNVLRRSCGGQLVAIITMLFCVVVHAQPSALLEACNSIEDKDKRLACFKELSNLKSSGSSNEAAGKRVKNAFAAIAGAVNSGVSFNNYSAMILEPAKEIGIFKQEIPTPSQRVLDLFDQSLSSYHDAAKVWQASIYHSDDAVVQGILIKYNLPARTVDVALPIIWRYAEERAKAAVDILEGRSTGVDLSTDLRAPGPTAHCDKWGNPKDMNGNPCE